jgi:hypothetical protein
MQPSHHPYNHRVRSYTIKEKLLVALNFLAHCHTLRQMAQKWGMPHNSISKICLHPSVSACTPQWRHYVSCFLKMQKPRMCCGQRALHSNAVSWQASRTGSDCRVALGPLMAA